jgi:molecular chaperone GrpE (heat shock protein)
MSDEELKNDAHPEDAGAEAEAASDPLGALLGELEEARQQILYAQAETQNVRRRLEKDAQDARAYAATNFARDVLSVADNLTRALDAMPAAMREDEHLEPELAVPHDRELQWVQLDLHSTVRCTVGPTAYNIRTPINPHGTAGL